MCCVDRLNPQSEAAVGEAPDALSQPVSLPESSCPLLGSPNHPLALLGLLLLRCPKAARLRQSTGQRSPRSFLLIWQ